MGWLEDNLGDAAPSNWFSGEGFSGSDAMNVIPGVGDAAAAKEANKTSAKNAADANAFSERMSNSAYQRVMDDMKKAGLNPMLAFSQGGASTPSPNVPSVTPVNRSKLGEFAMNTAMSAGSLKNATALAANTMVDSQQNRTLSATQSAKNVADTERIALDTKLKQKELPTAELTGDLSKQATSILNKLMDGIRNSAKPDAIPKPEQLDRSSDKRNIENFKQRRKIIQNQLY